MFGWLLVMAGAVIGAAVANVIFYFRAGSGTLKIDHTDPERDYVRLELDTENLKKSTKKFILKVDHNAVLERD